jgi:hypothetical protein
MDDFLEQLAHLEVRQPPPAFDRQLHQRVNRALVAQHVFNLIVAAAPGALLHFLRGAVAVLDSSVRGVFDAREPEKPREDGPQESL